MGSDGIHPHPIQWLGCGTLLELIDQENIIEMIEKEHAGENIVVKPHPRDTFKYRSDKVKFHILNTQLPAQLVLKKMIKNGKQPKVIYDFPSTVFLDTGIQGEMYRIKTENKEYNRAFSSIA